MDMAGVFVESTGKVSACNFGWWRGECLRTAQSRLPAAQHKSPQPWSWQQAGITSWEWVSTKKFQGFWYMRILCKKTTYWERPIGIAWLNFIIFFLIDEERKQVWFRKIKWVYIGPQSSSPQPFWHQGLVSWKIIFPWTGVAGRGVTFRMIRAHHIYYTFYFNYYYISSTSDHQALDPRGWGPLL